MGNYSTSDLIRGLSDDVPPVVRPWSPARRLLLWSTFTLALTYVCVELTGGWRSGAFREITTSSQLLLQLLLGTLTFLGASYASLELSVPATRPRNRLVSLALFPLLLLLALVLLDFFSPALSPSWEGWRFGCEREIVLFASVPFVFLLILIRRVRPLEKGKVGLLAGIAAATPAAVAMQLGCMYLPWHSLLFHFLPIFLVGYLGALCGRRFF